MGGARREEDYHPQEQSVLTRMADLHQTGILNAVISASRLLGEAEVEEKEEEEEGTYQLCPPDPQHNG